MKLRRGFVVLLLTAALAGPGRADASSARGALEAYYARYDRFWEHRDLKAVLATVEGVLAPGFTLKRGGGDTLTREQVLAVARSEVRRGGIPGLKTVNQKSRIQTLKMEGGTTVAVVLEKRLLVFTDNVGYYGTVGKDHRLTRTGVSRDTWVRLGSKWKLKSSTILSQSTVMDGRSLPSPGRPADR